MKRKIILSTIISLILTAAISAQTKTNFSGDWELDVSKSKLAMPLESMSLKVSQTDKELSVETDAKRAAGETRGGMGGGGGRGGKQSAVYNLEGKDIETDISGGAMSGKETRKATMTSDGKLNLNSSRVFTGQMGGVTMKTNEIWEVLDAGKTLKVTRYMETPRGATNSEMFFTRKTPVPAAEVVTTNSSDANISATGGTSRKISGGVLNGKALLLPIPEYPAAARAVRATGAVNVQVTIDEQGNVISASAVSGHPLLRQAAEEAARKATFTATRLEGNPVSVTGILVYNFIP